ncbi:tyrosine-protein phosphatase non-receptor type 1 [Malurus melanocephalus]|uniref:tyrosine-protein phosphatase non-receptor type 1 n=1 Tax=Malurus melanocephalus TaxID=175006 RepID=UPI002547DB71|nr:tyrosine-protein phosphatase non-receptor type 1 [Malurus melanocephalus]
MEIEKEFQRLDQAASWAAIYQDIRHEASDFPCKVAKHPRNKNRNRYRDVSPFDHSRIKLNQGENDYINASLIKMEEAQRSYILTQGPLPNTCGHFWEMVWEQKSRGVVMLNRVMEKGSVKCAQYWPRKEEKEMFFEDTNLKLTLISEDIKSYYTVRQLELENLSSQETREILHFHYTTWPDFGVPESPASFLNFLFKVRESGSLSPGHGPVVVHCSAGIGRSGTFCLVDTCLLLMDKRKDPSSVDVKQVLLEMRKYRMGLIQTADQLRFSYLAVIEGAKFIMGDASVQVSAPQSSQGIAARGWEEQDGKKLQIWCLLQLHISHDTEIRRRTVGDTPRLSPHHDEPGKAESPEEEDDNVVTTWKPFLVNICMFTFLTAGAYLCYRVCFH